MSVELFLVKFEILQFCILVVEDILPGHLIDKMKIFALQLRQKRIGPWTVHLNGHVFPFSHFWNLFMVFRIIFCLYKSELNGSKQKEGNRYKWSFGRKTHKISQKFMVLDRNELWTRIMTPKVMKSYSDYISISSISLPKDPARENTFETLPNQKKSIP